MITRIKRRLQRLIKNPYELYANNTELQQLFTGYKNAIILGSASSINKIDVTQYSEDMVITVGNFYEHPQIEVIKPKV